MPHTYTTLRAIAECSQPAAADGFVYAPGCGCQVIRDFQNGIDTIDLRDFGFGDVEALLAHAVARGGCVVINLGRTDTLTIEGVYLAQLDASDFRL